MLLLIDAGNTRIKWAMVAEADSLGAWSVSGAVLHAEAERLGAIWGAASISRVLAANVAGPAMRARLSGLLGATPAEWFRSSAAACGLKNGYRDPEQLGCDRFAAAIGAWQMQPGQRTIVATCGTATTIDAISADGVFLGGMIAPGLGTMAASLARNTAQLPQVQAHAPFPQGFADNTDDAILSGCIAAQAGAIERACRMHQAQSLLLSGGAASYISPALSIPHRIVDNIVLLGLHAVALGERPC
ncbi:type III pantothenate kinase [Massilia sp. TS11]|uniref:type III pantothenate kinase n=1 Tax=Massilia sp. TS11 TaxID=2908003 RepID=UPI001EDAED1A|nr:type III pantothenate kinase [Massilia sp. TS11]MCG2585479.1 type III pantothenate kinase [Massilia sp. TS11]